MVPGFLLYLLRIHLVLYACMEMYGIMQTDPITTRTHLLTAAVIVAMVAG